MDKNYWLIHLGQGNRFARDAFQGGYIGLNFLSDIDLSNDAGLDFSDFKNKYVPVIMKKEKSRTRVSAGLAIGNTWTATSGIKEGDLVLMPMGDRTYQVGEVIGGYYYERCTDDSGVSHRRKVKWIGTFSRDDMSETLKNSSGGVMTVFQLTNHAVEIQSLLGQKAETSEIENLADFWSRITFGRIPDF